MIIDRQAIAEFPFHGVFYEVMAVTPTDGDILGDKNDGTADGDLLGDEDEYTETSDDAETTAEKDGETGTSEEETVLLETTCDIQRASELMSSGTIMADYEVYCPCEKGAAIPIRFNTKFRCTDYAIPVQGRVVGFEYSQLGGFHVRIKMSET